MGPAAAMAVLGLTAASPRSAAQRSAEAASAWAYLTAHERVVQVERQAELPDDRVRVAAPMPWPARSGLRRPRGTRRRQPTPAGPDAGLLTGTGPARPASSMQGRGPVANQEREPRPRRHGQLAGQRVPLGPPGLLPARRGAEVRPGGRGQLACQPARLLSPQPGRRPTILAGRPARWPRRHGDGQVAVAGHPCRAHPRHRRQARTPASRPPAMAVRPVRLASASGREVA